MIKAPHPALDLSFMRLKNSKEGGGIDHWDVTMAGGYSADYERGEKLAGEYLDYIGRHPTAFNSTLLGCIVQDMGAPKNGVMLGFLRVVNSHAMLAARLPHLIVADSESSGDLEPSIDQLFAIWKQHRAAVAMADAADEAAVNTASDAAYEVGQRLLKMPAVTARDFAMKVIVSTTADAFEIDADLMKEALDLAEYQRRGE